MQRLLFSLESLLSWENLSRISSVISIASLGLTLWVLLETRKLRTLYKLRGRGPSLIKDLAKMASGLSKYLNDYSNSLSQIAQELGKIESKLKSLEPKLSGSPKGSVKLLRSSIDQLDVKTENEEQVRRTYIEVIKVIEELKDHQKDLNWEL
jgi:predicted  nucleic acid-binding Zn-ribbon protein